VRHLANLDTVAVRDYMVTIPLRSESIRGRVYSPLRAGRQAVLLVSGLHAAGIDEPRLTALARRLAESDVIVVTPEIPELARFDVNPVVTDHIEDATLWLATTSGLASDGRVGLMGISFSGGLAVVAAGRPSLKGRLRYVFSFGGHDDLARVLEYLCSGRGEDSMRSPPPHDYGVAVVTLTVAERLVPPEQVGPLRDAVRRFLWASYLDVVDKPRAQREFAALREIPLTMPEPSSSLLELVNDRDVERLGPLLSPYVADYASDPALSPARSPAPSAPVYLLHGREDTVIPASESRRLAGRLQAHGVRLLVTDLISHAEADRPAHVLDILKLASFWGSLLEQ
jgi:dienelactone hydrolase